MTCPGCGAAVEEGADLCLECGEPMGDSPAARAARSEVRQSAAAQPVRQSAAPYVEPPTVPLRPPRPRAARRDEEPEPIRCPGCGIPTRRTRCPGCGAVLRHDED